jgi:hypothetical protein
MARLGNWHWDVAANDVNLSDEMYRIYGLKPRSEQLTFETLLGYVQPDDRERVSGSLSRTLQDRGAFTLERPVEEVAMSVDEHPSQGREREKTRPETGDQDHQLVNRRIRTLRIRPNAARVAIMEEPP